LTVVGWLWKSATCSVHYKPEHANIWARMIHRHLTIPHRFVLITDYVGDQVPSPESRVLSSQHKTRDARLETRFDPLITPIPLWSDWRNLKRLAWGRFKPYCYVRLKAFSEEFGKILKASQVSRSESQVRETPDPRPETRDAAVRFVSIDLDCVVLANLDCLFDRAEDFLIIRRPAPRVGAQHAASEYERLGNYQASMWMMNAGARKKVWEDFKGSESIAAAARYLGSDQAWLNHILPDERGWNADDGVHGFLNLHRENRWNDTPPPGARIVFFNGTIKPWEFFHGRTGYPWIVKNYQ